VPNKKADIAARIKLLRIESPGFVHFNLNAPHLYQKGWEVATLFRQLKF
jgi:hypothetical protein